MQTVFGFIITFLTAAAAAYLIGSLNGAIVSVRLLKHADIRDFGSGNAGLTNVLRCFGKGCGILTLLIDLGKGACAMLLVQGLCKWLHLYAMPDGAGSDYRWTLYLAAVFAVLGHVFPLWHGFKGGKGVLVGVSVFLVISPLTFLILMAVFAAVLLCSKYVSLASCIATLCVIPVTLVQEILRCKGAWGMPCLYTAMIACAAFLVVWSHRENIKRLRAGTERRIGEKKQKE